MSTLVPVVPALEEDDELELEDELEFEDELDVDDGLELEEELAAGFEFAVLELWPQPSSAPSTTAPNSDQRMIARDLSKFEDLRRGI